MKCGNSLPCKTKATKQASKASPWHSKPQVGQSRIETLESARTPTMEGCKQLGRRSLHHRKRMGSNSSVQNGLCIGQWDMPKSAGQSLEMPTIHSHPLAARVALELTAWFASNVPTPTWLEYSNDAAIVPLETTSCRGINGQIHRAL